MGSNPDPQSCLESTEFVDCRSEVVKAHVTALNLEGLAESARAVRVFEYVRDNLKYEFGLRRAREEYLSSHVLEDGRGFCVRKAMALCGLGRAAGIPTALVLCDMRDESLPPHAVEALGTDMMFHHGLNAFFLNGTWVKVDASLSPNVVAKKNYRPLVFDGKTDCLQERTTLDGKPHAEYVTFHGLYADLPYDQMMEAYVRDYDNTNPELLASMGATDPGALESR